MNPSALPALRRRTFLAASAAATATAAWPQAGWSPSRAIRLVVTYPPGGGADVSARAITEKLGQKLGQPIIVENRGGAGGVVGTEQVYRAAPDGYTLLWGNADTLAIAPHLFAKLPYKPLDFAAIAPVCGIGFVMVGRQGLEAKDFPELLAMARAKELSFASWGNGSPGHVGCEMIKTLGKVPKALNVPFQGTAPAAQAVLAGQVDLMFMPMPLWLAMNSKVVTYGVAAKSRYERMKQVPTLAEMGVPADLEVWQGLFAPPQTPRAVVERVHKAITEVVSEPDVKARLEELGTLPLVAGLDEFSRSIPRELARWGEIMKTAQVQPQG
jgi:tripartite-type tricarboxylate transporter receptor subunit TctC